MAIYASVVIVILVIGGVYYAWQVLTGSDDVGPTEKVTFMDVVSGAQHYCGLKPDGLVVCAGDDEYGQSSPPSGAYESITAGDFHTCGVKTDGSVECWGGFEKGASLVNPVMPPGSSRAAVPPDGTFTSVSAGKGHTCGVRTDALIQCWGSNKDLLGDGRAGQATPPLGRFLSVSAGGWHTCGVRTGGSVECWGDDAHGQATPPSGRFLSVSAGGMHTCGVRTGGSVECWGSDDHGQSTPPLEEFIAVSSGYNHSCGIRSDGRVYCWGYNEDRRITPPSGEFRRGQRRPPSNLRSQARRHGRLLGFAGSHTPLTLRFQQSPGRSVSATRVPKTCKGQTPAKLGRGLALYLSGGADPIGDYTSILNLTMKVLDFIQFGGHGYARKP